MEISGIMNMNMDVNMNMLGHHHHHIDHYNINNSNIVSIGQNGNDHLAMCDIWQTTANAATNNSTTTDYSNNLFYPAAEVTVAATDSEVDTSCHPFLLGHPLQQQQQQERLQLSNMNIYGGRGSHYQPDPHLMCLNLGKRHYFEDNAHVPSELLYERHVGGFPVGMTTMMMMSKGGNAAAAEAQLYGAGALSGPKLARRVVPRCQVEGCHVVLLNAKDYHRRHKVCEMHSKASKVTVYGRPHRFCQQCSKFQLLSEFDKSKRSCRRRLAGHNERRRKSPHHSQDHKAMGGRRFQYLSSSTRRALSFLSSRTRYDSWVSPSDPSSGSSDALRELIVQNRAAILARELLISSSSSSDINCWDSSSSSHNNNVHAITEDLFADYGQPWSNSIDESNHQHHQDQMFPGQNHYQHG